MKTRKNLVNKLLIGSLILITGCTSFRYPQNITSIENPLDKRQAEITYNILKRGEKEFIQLEKEFYNALDSGNTNTSNFDSLQRKYHSLKAEREKYENILKTSQLSKK